MWTLGALDKIRGDLTARSEGVGPDAVFPGAFNGQLLLLHGLSDDLVSRG